MAEFVSLLVLNSLFAARSSAVRSASFYTPPTMLYLTTTRTHLSNFFTPNPRRLQGKARASPQDPSSHLLFDSSRPWPRHSFRDVSFDKCSLAQESSASPQSAANSHSFRRSIGSRSLPSSHRRYSTPRHLALKFINVHQRRHASSTSDRKNPLPVVEQLKDVIYIIEAKKSAHGPSFDPEQAWELFHQVQQRRALLAIGFDDLMILINRLANDVQQYYGQVGGSEKLALWGDRIRSIIDSIQERAFKASPHYFSLKSLRVRSSAMLGRFDEAEDLLDQLGVGHDRHFVESSFIEGLCINAHREILDAMKHFYDPVRALDWLSTRWSAIGSYLVQSQIYMRDDHRRMVSLRESVVDVVAEIEFPVMYLADRCHEWPPDRLQVIAEYMARALCLLDLPADALAVMEEMQRQSFAPSISLRLTLIAAFVRDKSFELANTLYSALAKSFGSDPHPADYLSTGLLLFAHQGDVIRAKERFDNLKRRNGLRPRHIGLMLHAFAVNGQTTETVQFFEDYFPPHLQSTALRFGKPSIVHFSELVFAYAQRGDDDGVNAWLAKMSAYGYVPDQFVYNKILKSFASRGDLEFIARLLDQMRSDGVEPTQIAYTTILSLLAERQDAVGAELIYHRALKEGIVPDRAMINALMHAHVEAGSWQGVVRAFDYMMSAKDRRLRPSIVVLNTLLKAYVLIGAPFRVVSQVFSRLDEVGVRPTARTFALLIQSACDAGHMDIAMDLFREMEKLADQWQSSLHITVYVLTLIMNGYLVQDNKQGAKEIYDDMKRRNIAPSAVTLGVIVNAYTKDKTEESLKLAREFIQSCVGKDPFYREWDKPLASRRSALETVYHPLMNAYAKENRFQEAEELYQEMLEAGGEPTLGLLAVLLDSYRRSGNAEAARQVWPQIFQLALRFSQVSLLTEEHSAESSMPKKTPRPSTILCIPLSIYVDALSMAGYHTEIADTWTKCRMHNFAFDSHNWNHLIVALVRAGEPERAFEILERVILLYQREAELMCASREMEPKTPLTFGADAAPPPGDDSLPEPVSESPMHNTDRRRSFVGRSTRRMEKRLLREPSDDFAHPLYVLHQVSPSWGIWKPHTVTLGVLAKVIEHLSSGRVVQPLKPREESNTPRVLENDSIIRARRELAAEILRRIYTEFPQAVRVVEEYDMRQRQRTERQLEIEKRQDVVWT